ncbi:hypothetical protein TNCV_273911 [Trichonephila clavipes]|nr:hypothetical protein TNCV_273911 [Trichonephila clavipes]
MKHVLVSDTLSPTQDFEWHHRLREGRESANDYEHSGCPETSSTAENIKKFSAVVQHHADDPLQFGWITPWGVMELLPLFPFHQPQEMTCHLTAIWITPM